MKTLLALLILAGGWTHNGNPGARGYGPVKSVPTNPTISIDSVSHNEGNAGTTSYVFTVTLSGASSQAVTVAYATADVTATAGVDYVAKSGSLRIEAGTTGTITVLVNGDLTLEGDETFSLVISNPINGIITAATGTGTIVSDDLQLLPCSGTCDLHFVADDWSGTGNWTSRDSNAWVGSVIGAPTHITATQFPARTAVSNWSNNSNFTITGAAAHTVQANDLLTYEFVFGNYPTPGSDTMFFGALINNVTWSGLMFDAGPTFFEFNIPKSTANAFYLGADSAAAVLTYAKANLVTMTIDVAGEHVHLYENGTEVSDTGFPISASSGVLVPQNTDIAIGGRRFGGATDLAVPAATELLEIVRYREVLSAGAIATRATQFNALKGY